MRGRMSDAPSYAAPVEIGGVMVGGTVSQVVATKTQSLKKVNGFFLEMVGRLTRSQMARRVKVWACSPNIPLGH